MLLYSQCVSEAVMMLGRLYSQCVSEAVLMMVEVLEKLYKEKWSQRDGLGALIISPTRELAVQTFKALQVLGRHHDFSADVVIGGKV